MSAQKSRFPAVHCFPRGTYRLPAFYFRGADLYSEPEFIADSLIVARTAFAKAKRQLEKVQAEFRELEDVFSERDEYTVAIASSLGEASAITEEDSHLRHLMVDLTSQIAETEQNIAYYKHQQHEGVMTSLLRERAQYHADIENLRILTTKSLDKIHINKLEASEIVGSPLYCMTLYKGAELASLTQLHQHLRTKMNKLFQNFNSLTPPKKVERHLDNEAHALKALIEAKQQMAIELEELQHERYYSEILAVCSALTMIDQIDATNQVLVSLGGEALDVDELRSHFHPPPAEEMHDPPAEKRTASRTSRRAKPGYTPSPRPKSSQVAKPRRT
jgi:hypothetical protein